MISNAVDILLIKKSPPSIYIHCGSMRAAKTYVHLPITQQFCAEAFGGPLSPRREIASALESSRKTGLE
jgi:hypothetical protein